MTKQAEDTRKYLPEDLATKHHKPLANMVKGMVEGFRWGQKVAHEWYTTVVTPIYNAKNDVTAAELFNSACAAYGVAKLPEGFVKRSGLPNRSTLGALLVLARTTEQNQERIAESLKAGTGINAVTKDAREAKWIEPAKPRLTKPKVTPPEGEAPKVVSLESAGPVGSLDRIIAFLSNYSAVTFFPRGAVDYREVMQASPTPAQAMKSVVNAATIALQTLNTLEQRAHGLLAAERKQIKGDEKAA